MSSHREPIKLADVGLVLLTILTIGIVVLALRPPEPPPVTAADLAGAGLATPAPTNDTPAAEDQPVVVVLGDSFTNGGEDYDGPTWTDLVARKRGWTIDVSAPGGAGYVTPGGGRPLPERATAALADHPDADLWVVAAGASDVARRIPLDDVVAAATQALDTIEAGSQAPVVLLSPFAVAAPGEPTLALRDALQEVCAAAQRCSFVDATSWFDRDAGPLMDPAGLNPTLKGQKVLAKKLLRALPEL